MLHLAFNVGSFDSGRADNRVCLQSCQHIANMLARHTGRIVGRKPCGAIPLSAIRLTGDTIGGSLIQRVRCAHSLPVLGQLF